MVLFQIDSSLFCIDSIKESAYLTRFTFQLLIYNKIDDHLLHHKGTFLSRHQFCINFNQHLGIGWLCILKFLIQNKSFLFSIIFFCCIIYNLEKIMKTENNKNRNLQSDPYRLFSIVITQEEFWGIFFIAIFIIWKK